MTSQQQTTWIFPTRGRVREGPRCLESCLSSPPPRQREKKPRAKVGAEDSNTSYISWHGGAHITLPSQIKINVTELSRWVSPSPLPDPLLLFSTGPEKLAEVIFISCPGLGGSLRICCLKALCRFGYLNQRVLCAVLLSLHLKLGTLIPSEGRAPGN